MTQERQRLGKQLCARVDGHDPASCLASDLLKRLGELFAIRHDSQGSRALLEARPMIALTFPPARVQPDPVGGAWIDLNRPALLCARSRPDRSHEELVRAGHHATEVDVGGEGLAPCRQPGERAFDIDPPRSQDRPTMAAGDPDLDGGQAPWRGGPATEGQIAADECSTVQSRAVEPHDAEAVLCGVYHLAPTSTFFGARGAPLAARRATHSRAMIAFGCPVTDREKYSRFAEPGIRRAIEPDSALLLRHHAPSIQVAYNSMLEEAGARSELEALVLLHQDVELRDGDLAEKLRACMRDPLVAVVGAVGSDDVRSLEWWRTGCVGGVTAPGLVGPDVLGGGPPALAAAESVDGLLLALSPWAVRTLRFDERFAPYFHGYDVDLCFQARERGRRVAVVDIDVVHHARMGFFDRRTWVPAYRLWHRKWGGDTR